MRRPTHMKRNGSPSNPSATGPAGVTTSLIVGVSWSPRTLSRAMAASSKPSSSSPSGLTSCPDHEQQHLLLLM